jgi:glycogen(starch) synthase
VRILFWSDLFWPYIGGSEIFAAKLLLSLRERHEFIVVTRQDSANLPLEDSYDGIPVFRFPFCTAMSSGDLGQVMALRKQVAKLKRNFAADLVHIHNFGPSILFQLETSAACPAPVLFTVQMEISPYKTAGADTLMERTLRAADWVNCVSSETLAQVRKRVPETALHSSVVFNGLHVFPLLPKALPFKPPTLLCVGRLQRQKGFDLALSAMVEIIERFPEVRLIIAGDGPEQNTLKRQIAELNLTSSVNLIGWVSPDHVLPLINSATMVMIPSRYEGFPLVGLEAALMARPIVASRISGLSEIVVDGQTGLLIEPENNAALIEAIVFFLTHPEVAEQMGWAGRSRVRKLFSWDQCVHAYDSLYRNLGPRQFFAKQEPV